MYAHASLPLLSSDTGKLSSVTVSYPCSMLNVLVHRNFANDQYQTLMNPDKHTYKTQAECSIFFEGMSIDMSVGSQLWRAMSA